MFWMVAMRPGVAVVQQDFYEMGSRATRRLFERLGGDDGPPGLDLLTVPLVPRGSGEIGPNPQR